MDPENPKFEVSCSWRSFLIQYEFAKHYHLIQLLSASNTAPRNAIVDSLIASLLFMRAASILDEALSIEVEMRALSPSRRSLTGRIKVLADCGALQQGDQLLDFRDRRNKLAHQQSATATWEEVEEGIDLIESVLQAFSFAGPRPKLEYFGERGAFEDSPDPGVIGIRQFRCGIRLDGETALETCWTERLMKSEA